MERKRNPSEGKNVLVILEELFEMVERLDVSHSTIKFSDSGYQEYFC